MITSKNILLIEPFLPCTCKSGGHVAIYNSLKAIHEEFEKVFIVFPTKPYESLQKEIEILKSTFLNVEVLPFFDSRKKKTPLESCKKEIYRFLKRIDKKNTPIAQELYGVKDYPNEYQQFIKDTIEQHAISIVQIEFYWLLPLVACLPKNITKIFVHHEIGFVRQQLNLDLWGRNAYREAAVRLGEWFEIALLNQYDAVITLSDIDRQKLIAAGVKVPVYASMAVVDCKPYCYKQPLSTKTITFLGPHSHYPNWDGVMWFLENCWGKLLERDSYFQLRIIGDWKKSKIRKIKKHYSQVNFMGMVDDLGAALEDTTMIVPIRIGSGIRMKILEAAQLGVPFVTTSVGVEGLPFISGEDCFIIDDAEEFVDCIIQLENKELRNKFTTSARKKVNDNFSFEGFKQNRIGIIRQIIADITS